MNRLLLALLLFAVLTSCKQKKDDERQQRADEISEAKADFYASIDGQYIDYGKARYLNDKYDSFVKLYPKDTLAPEFLMEQALLCGSFLGESKKAVDLYLKIVNEYRKSDQVPFALFAAADLFKNKLQDTENAQKLYMELIEKYPQNPWAKEAEILLQYIGLTDEEMLEEILKKAAEQDLMTLE